MMNFHRNAVTRRLFLRSAYQIGATALVALPTVVVARQRTTGSAATSNTSGVLAEIRGTVTDLATLAPLPGATITAEPGGFAATTDVAGTYSLTLPPGRYSVEFSAPSFITETHLNQVAGDGLPDLDATLLPVAPSPDQQLLLYTRTVRQTVSPLVEQFAIDRLGSMGRLTSIPTTITVNYDAATGHNPPYKISVPLEDYVKGVVPNEVPASWPANTLQAQAVAARSYGIAAQLAYGYVYPDTRSQVYTPDHRYSTTDAAVDATAGVVVTVNGSVVFTFFFSSCNGVSTRDSENLSTLLTDSNGNIVRNSSGQAVCANCTPGVSCWNYVSYCRARPCTGHGPSSNSDCGYWGHGVGMCQWGAYSRANLSFVDILNSYYSGITITGFSQPATATPKPTLTPTPSPTPTSTPSPTPTPIPTPQPTGPFLVLVGQRATLTWLSVGSGAQYTVTLSQGSQTFVWNTTNTYQDAGVLALGAWAWTVQASNHMSASATLRVVTKIYSSVFPFLE